MKRIIFLIAIILFSLASCVLPSGGDDHSTQVEKMKYSTWKARRIDHAVSDSMLMSANPENIDMEKMREVVSKQIDQDSIKLGWKETIFRH